MDLIAKCTARAPLCLVAVLISAPALHAQQERMVRVEGHDMRVWTSGLDLRKPGQPVVVFENGARAPIEAWGEVPGRVAPLAPVVAYDRTTVGASAWDGQVGTPGHVAARLRGLLQAIDVPPPYVLVGWSYGGDLVRHHVGLHPDAIAGVVYVDPAIHSPAASVRVLERVGSGITEHRRHRAAVETLFSTLTPRGQAEIQPQMELYRDHVEQEFRSAPMIPTSVLLAGKYEAPSPQEVEALGQVPYDRRAHHDARLRDRIDRFRDWVLDAPAGLFVVARNSGHAIQADAPDLVVAAIEAVLFPDPAATLRKAIDGGGVAALNAAQDSLAAIYPPEHLGEGVLNDLGYALLREGRHDDAIAVFDYNVRLHPDAWNPHDSLGDAYAAAGRMEEAIEAYRRSLELNPQSPSGRKLENLARP